MNSGSDELRLIVRAEERGRELAIGEIARLLALSDPDAERELLAAARRVRLAEVGRKVYLRGLVEVSNICRRDCLYCGIRRSNAEVRRYSLAREEILADVRRAVELGYGAVVLQGGERCDEIFCRFIEDTVRAIRELPRAPGITLSFGEESLEVYRRWRAAGAARYLLRIESTDPALFRRIHSAESGLEARAAALDRLREAGFQLGTGVMIGLPEQSVEMLARDIDFFRRIDADMIGMGPYIPHPATPLGAEFPADAETNARRLALGIRMIAVTRLVLRDVNIAATTALQTLDPERGRERGLLAGANVIMPNIGEVEHRRDYQLYEGKPGIDENAEAIRRALEKSVAAVGDTIAYGEEGTPLHYTRRTAGDARRP